MNFSGVLFFPVTPFDGEDALAEDVLTDLTPEHLAELDDLIRHGLALASA